MQVLAEQVPSIPNIVLILFEALGVGIFLAIAMIRALKKLALSKLLLVFYAFIVIIAFFAPNKFVPTAFDSGGVATGPITVPFIMAPTAITNTIMDEVNKSFGLKTEARGIMCSVPVEKAYKI